MSPEPEVPTPSVTIPKIDPVVKPDKKPDPKKQSRRHCVVLYLVLVLLPLAILSYFIYHGFGVIHSFKTQLLRQQIVAQHQNTSLKTNFNEFKAETDVYNKRIQDLIDAQALQLHQLSDKHNWRISEAIYLVAIAQERLNMVGDASTAIRLLQTAEDRLKNVADVRTSRARESIAHDISNLMNTARFDKIGLWVELGVLRKQIESLSFHTLQGNIEGQPEVLNESEPVPAARSAWREALDKTWQELKGLVKVREFNADKLNSSLEPKDQILLLRAMDLMLIEAQWGLLQEEPVVYQQSLDRLLDKLHIYFVQDELCKQVEAQINILKTKNIKPQPVDLSHTLVLLKSLDTMSVQSKTENAS